MSASPVFARAQVLKQCEKWCPEPEALFSSAPVQDQQPDRQRSPLFSQQLRPAAKPQWGWDDLEYSVGDTLNTGMSRNSLPRAIAE
jgi:hypothetical protein